MIDPVLPKIALTLEEFPFPKRFAVELTAECNLTCSMCHQPSMKRPKGVMPFELWKRCADEIAAVSRAATECWFSFCGEPLLEAGLLLRMLAYGKFVGLRSLNLNTNGVLLTPAISERLVEAGMESIVIGIDGFTSETYARVRCGGDRDLVYDNVNYLLRARSQRSAKVDVQVQFIEMDENEHEREAFCGYWLEQGATLKIRNKLSWGGRFNTPLHIPPEDRIACPWAVTMMHVFWDGRVPRCPGDTEGDEGPGNAWHETLAVLWKRMANVRADHLNHRFELLPERCQTCKDWMTGAARRVRPHKPPHLVPIQNRVDAVPITSRARGSA
jgi:pyruvate-formate lyase-activating enzyme